MIRVKPTKSVNHNLIPWIIAGILLIICAISISTCNSKADESTSWKGLYDYQNARVDSFLNRKGQQVTETHAAITASPEDIKKLSADIFDLKKSLERKIKEVSALVTATQKGVIKDSTIAFEPDPNPIDGETMVKAKDVIIPPRRFHDSTKWYAIAGTVLLEGVKFDSIVMHNDISFRIAEKKEGLFKKRETVVQAVNSSPYFSNTGMRAITLSPVKTAWNQWIKPVLVAIATLVIKNQL